MEKLTAIAHKLAEKKALNLYRRRIKVAGADGVFLTCGKAKYLSFCSNNYLGLANHPKVIAAFQQHLNKHGANLGASALTCGYSAAHYELEHALEKLVNYPRVLLFATGYQANLGVLTALCGKQDRVLVDRLSHASIIDGARFCGAQFERYRHLDMHDLERRLQRSGSSSASHSLIASDGVFSVDGDVAPLAALVDLAAKYQSWLMLDDAHGIGVLGKDGSGLVGTITSGGKKPTILVGTFGKAFGTYGAFVASNKLIIEYLIQTARPYIYTTAPPPALAVATLESLFLLKEESWRRTYLQKLIAYFQQQAQSLQLPVTQSTTPIQTVHLGLAAVAEQVYQKLLHQKLLVGLIRPPTVPPNRACLRISLTANHTQGQIDFLLGKLTVFCSQIKSNRYKNYL